MSRVFLIVLDSFGIGEMPDARKYRDEGSNTLRSVASSPFFNAPNLQKLGLFNIDGVQSQIVPSKDPKAAYIRLSELSPGKDTTTGHWEMAGYVLPEKFPTFRKGFPKSVIDAIKEATGRGVLCNMPFSGTEVIKMFGDEHVKTGKLIVYTSADSVLQIAAHEDVVPLDTLYDYCKKVRQIMQGKYGVGRIIARPFVGKDGDYIRTPNRHDFSLVPPQKTLLNVLQEAGKDVISVGKINDIFAGSGITKAYTSKGNDEGMEITLNLQKEDFDGLCFVNLVDFDMLYGHRNDVDGYAKAISSFDKYLGVFVHNMKDDDVLMITADHGCDPLTPSTDHSREYVPLLIYGARILPKNLGTRAGFNYVAGTVLDILNVQNIKMSKSLYKEVKPDV